MKKQNINTIPVHQNHPSDGTELIPSEIHSDVDSNEELPLGYTQDDEGLMNNFATEPDMSKATYPTPKKQLRYIFIGIGAIMFVALLLLIASAVS
jgi:hypothetical protein